MDGTAAGFTRTHEDFEAVDGKYHTVSDTLAQIDRTINDKFDQTIALLQTYLESKA